MKYAKIRNIPQNVSNRLASTLAASILMKQGILNSNILPIASGGIELLAAFSEADMILPH